jgi:hypothetical protein
MMIDRQGRSPTKESRNTIYSIEGRDIETQQEIDNGASTEPVDTMPASSGRRTAGEHRSARAATTDKNYRGSQEADDDDHPAEWHAGTNKKSI